MTSITLRRSLTSQHQAPLHLTTGATSVSVRPSICVVRLSNTTNSDARRRLEQGRRMVVACFSVRHVLMH
jgi:hypothetical protein